VQYLGERVLRHTGIENGIGNLVTIQEKILGGQADKDGRSLKMGSFSRNLVGVAFTDRLGGEKESS
jgi:hypothetical protein